MSETDVNEVNDEVHEGVVVVSDYLGHGGVTGYDAEYLKTDQFGISKGLMMHDLLDESFDIVSGFQRPFDP